MEHDGKNRKEPLDVQFGCCLINKKLLLKALDALPKGGRMDLLAENSDVMKQTAGKYIDDKGCVITGIKDENGTCIITVMRK
jgi:hypothetical protein